MYTILVIIIIILIMIVYIQYDINKKYKIKIKELKIDNKMLSDKVIINTNRDLMTLEEKDEKEISNKDIMSLDEVSLDKAKSQSKELKKNKDVSPVMIPKEILEESFELDSFVNNRKKRINSSDNYLNHVSSKLNKGNNIELTKYEQDEEDNAIISYRELVNHDRRNFK